MSTTYVSSRKIKPIHIFLLFLGYLLITSPSLLRYPGPWVDEGWITEVAHQFAHGLPLGNPSHSELYRYADRVFWMPPLYFMSLGGWISLWGTTLEAARAFSLLLGGVTTLLLFTLLVRGFGTLPAWCGTLAWMTDTFVWKAHRTVRFEPALTLLALAAAAAGLHALARERNGTNATWSWAAAGLALAAMVNIHPNAVLLAPAVALYLLMEDGVRLLRRPGPWLALILGAAGLVPFGLYLLSDRTVDFVNVIGQNGFHFVAHDTPGVTRASEASRYAAYFPYPARLPAALLWLTTLVMAAAEARTDRRLRAPLASLALLLVGLALLPNKSLLYLTAAIPIGAVLLAALMAGAPAGGRAARGALALALLLVVANLAVDAALWQRNAGTDPRRIVASVSAELRPDDRVAGTFVTWWAAVDHPFREFQRVGSVAELEAFHPTVVIIGDRHWEEARATIFRELAPAVETWLASRGAVPKSFPDPVMGTIRVYRLPAAGP